MDLSTLNIWALLVATLSAFLLGGLWYSPLLFANPWMKAAGISQEQIEGANMVKIFGLAFLFELIMAFNLAMFLNDPAINLTSGMLYGFLTGFGWVALALSVNALYERKSFLYMVINGGYFTLSFTIMGAILGGWK